MARKDLSGDALKTPLTVLGRAGDITPGTWADESTEMVGSYGARMEELGCDPETIEAINASAASLLEFRDLVAPDGTAFDDKSLIRFGTDKNGGLAGVSGPTIRSREGKPVLVLGNNTLPIEEPGDGALVIGTLKGKVEVVPGKGYTSYRVAFSDPDSGDRYLVKAISTEGVTEDDVLDGLADGTSLGAFLKPVGQGSSSVNMKELPLGDYEVLRVNRRKGAEGRPDWFTLNLKDPAIEVKSRDNIDAVLRTGFPVDTIRSKGNYVVLSITSKEPFGDNKVRVGCGIQALPPEKAEPRLEASARERVKSVVDGPASARPSAAPAAPQPAAAVVVEEPEPAPKPETKPASKAAPKAASPAAVAAAARREAAASKVVVTEPTVDAADAMAEVSLEF